MKLYVDPDLCISCGLCIDTAPEIYDWSDDEVAEVIVDDVPPEYQDEALEALESCPTEAIKRKD